ncbi:MAG: type II toxin-antitoxin system RelE/ParE family toxin [Puniceicoccales bacterium]
MLPDPDAASRLADDILEVVNRLKSFPYVGRHFGENSKGSIYEVTCRRRRIFFQVFDVERTLLIVHVRAGERTDPRF